MIACISLLARESFDKDSISIGRRVEHVELVFVIGNGMYNQNYTDKGGTGENKEGQCPESEGGEGEN